MSTAGKTRPKSVNYRFLAPNELENQQEITVYGPTKPDLRVPGVLITSFGTCKSFTELQYASICLPSPETALKEQLIEKWHRMNSKISKKSLSMALLGLI